MNFAEKEIYQSLKSQYNTELLNKKQLAEVLNISVSKLDRLRKNGLGISYKQMPSSNGSWLIRYPLMEVVKFIVSNNQKTL